jgi:hypothetical protein
VIDVSYGQPPTLIVLQRKGKAVPNEALQDMSLRADPER